MLHKLHSLNKLHPVVVEAKKKEEDNIEVNQIQNNNKTNKSKFKVLLFGGADFFNDGTYVICKSLQVSICSENLSPLHVTYKFPSSNSTFVIVI